MGKFYIVFSISLIGLFFLIINSFLFVTKQKNRDNLYKTLTCYLVSLSIIEIICNYIGFFKPGNNLFLSHFYFNFQFIFLSFFFYKLFENKLLKTTTTIVFLTIATILIIQYIVNPNLFWEFNLFEILSISFILICYSLIHLYNSLGKEKSYYYFCIGLISYLLCSSIIFMSGNLELVFCQNPYIDIWIFNSILYIVYQILIFKEWFQLNLNKTDEHK